MPIYEYYCQSCDYIFEELNKGYTDEAMECPVCGQEAKRLISNTSFILKGAGFYETDYKRKSTDSGNGKGKENAGGNGNGNGEAKAEKATATENNSQQNETSSSNKGSESSASNKGTSQDKD